MPVLSTFYINNPHFSLKYSKSVILGSYALPNFGGKKVAVLVFVSIQKAAEKEIFKLVFVLVLQ